MEDEEKITEDQIEVKPKSKQRPKVKLKETPAKTIKKEQGSKKTKNSTKKKKTTSTRKKKKVVEENIIIPKTTQVKNSDPIEPVITQTVEVAKVVDGLMEGSNLQPMGQAGFPEAAPEIKTEVEVFDKSDTKGRHNPNTSQVQEPTEIKINSHLVKLIDPVFSGKSQVEIAQNVDLPLTAIKVRNIEGKINNLVAEIINNKVIVQGIVHDQVFFVGNDGIVHHLANDINFSTFLDLPGVHPGMNSHVSAIIEDIIFELAADGLSILKKIVIEVFVKVTETVQINLETGNGPTLFLKKVVGENSAQTLVESDLTLINPAIKIDEIVGTIRDIQTDIIPDKVIVQGTLHKQLFYIDSANMERHQTEDIPFSIIVDIPGVTPGMDVQVDPRIEAIFFNLISATVVREKAVLEFFVKATENVLQQVTIGTGPLFMVEQFIGENTVQKLSETLITLNTPAIKVREIIARVQNLVTHVIPNKVLVQGTIHKQIFFIGSDNIEHHQAEDLPFSLFLDIAGVEPGDNVKIASKIEAIFFDLVSSTELRQKVIFEITAIVTQEEQLNLVSGLGSLFKVEQVIGENTKQVLVISTEQINPPAPINPVVTSVIVDPSRADITLGSQQILLQNTVQLPMTTIQIKEITATATETTIQLIPEGVVVEGNVNKTLVFIGNDNIVRTMLEKVPFSILVNIPNVTSVQVTTATVNVEEVIFNLNSAGTEVNQTLILQAVVTGQITVGERITVVTDVTGPGITQTKVMVQGLIFTPSGDVLQQFPVVTDVSGPGILSVTKQTVMLQKVGEPNPAPLVVVTTVQTV